MTLPGGRRGWAACGERAVDLLSLCGPPGLFLNHELLCSEPFFVIVPFESVLLFSRFLLHHRSPGKVHRGRGGGVVALFERRAQLIPENYKTRPC